MTMATLVQSYPQQTATTTMLQTRNGSGSGVMPSQPQGSQQYSNSQQHRNSFHGMPGASGGGNTYRGPAAPIQPYAFTATPSLNPAGQWQPYPTFRASSSSAVPTVHSFDHNNNAYPRSRHAINSSLPNLPSGGSRDDSALPPPGARRGSGTSRPQSAYFSSSTVSNSFNSAPPAKSQPDRYRRPALRTTESGPSQGSAAPSGLGMASVGHLYTPQSNNRDRRPSPSGLNRPSSFYAKMPGSVDDMQLYRSSDDSKRFRRRSMPALDTALLPKSLAPLDTKKADGSPVDQAMKSADKEQIKTARLVAINSPTTPSARNGSSESLVSSRSSTSRPSSVSSLICTHPREHCPITAICSPDLAT